MKTLLVRPTSSNPTGRISLGRHRPAQRPRLHLSHYVKAFCDTPVPDSCNYTPLGMNSLEQMYCNDVLGCCIISAGDHLVGVETGNAGQCEVADSSAVIKDYSAIGGYVPGDSSTDNGCDEQTAFHYWMANGFFDGTKLAGYCAVDATDQALCKATIYQFENLFLGIELPDEWLASPPQQSGFVWDVAGPPNPNNGHAVAAFGYTSQGILIATWGMVGIMTWPALAMYGVPSAGGECYTLLTPDEIEQGKADAPNGLAWDALESDFQALQGGAPSPQPVPASQEASLTLDEVTQMISVNWPQVSSQVQNAIKVGVGTVRINPAIVAPRSTLPSPKAGPRLEEVLSWVWKDVPPQWKANRLGEVFRRMVVESITANWPK